MKHWCYVQKIKNIMPKMNKKYGFRFGPLKFGTKMFSCFNNVLRNLTDHISHIIDRGLKRYCTTSMLKNRKHSYSTVAIETALPKWKEIQRKREKQRGGTLIVFGAKLMCAFRKNSPGIQPETPVPHGLGNTIWFSGLSTSHHHFYLSVQDPSQQKRESSGQTQSLKGITQSVTSQTLTFTKNIQWITSSIYNRTRKVKANERGGHSWAYMRSRNFMTPNDKNYTQRKRGNQK